MGICFDSNRLMKPTQRIFSAAWLESIAETVHVLPQVARELTHDKYVVDPIADLEAAKNTLRRVQQRGNERIEYIVACDVWWLNEFVRNESPYELVQLNAAKERYAAELRKVFPRSAFPHEHKDDIETCHDAIIVSEALVTSQRLLITSDEHSLKHKPLNEWVHRHANEYGLESGPVVFVQDDVLSTVFALDEQRLLSIALGAAWPDEYAANATVVERFQGQLQAMYGGALLSRTAAMIERAWDELTEQEKMTTLDHVREHYLPARTRHSESLHPALRSRGVKR